MWKKLQLCLYTLRHKVAFLQVEKKLRGKNTLSGYLHDAEKPLMYLFCFWMDAERIHQFHCRHNRHHVKNNLKKSPDDLFDTVIDWECARMTKPDKPLNAYDTLMKYYPQYRSTYLPVIKKYLPHQVREKED
ncbi:MAG: hypothetical protein IKY98_05540 [Alphaproteobacteria bacterium]|nr:hypothetical protein [Alphaproteobacteria bacterium]